MYLKLIDNFTLYKVRVDIKNLPRIRQHSWHVRKDKTGYLSVSTTIDRSPVILARFILNITDPSVQVDHIDGDSLNNREDNLRSATSQQNSWNRSKLTGCTSQYKGVHWYKRSNRWHADIMCNGIAYKLGYFVDEIDAALAYNEKAKELFGEFAKLNVVA